MDLVSISGPDRYQLLCGQRCVTVQGSDGRPKFKGRSAACGAKLYVLSEDLVPVYVGVTKQDMASRLRQGLTASGQHGYYGYRWFENGREFLLDIWFHESAREKAMLQDLEVIEAELVYLIRRNGQWPKFQTEIHFHRSGDAQRAAAKQIARVYRLGS